MAKDLIVLDITGGLGDAIIALPLVRQFFRKFNNRATIRVYTSYPEVFAFFLPYVELRHTKELLLPEVQEQIQFKIMIDDYIRFRIKTGVRLPKYLHAMHYEWIHNQHEWGQIIQNTPQLTNQGSIQAVKQGLNRRTLASHLLGLDVDDYVHFPVSTESEHIYITCHFGFDAKTDKAVVRSTKNWSLEAWGKLMLMMQEAFPTIKTIQLGGLRSQPIPHVTMNLAEKLTFRESMIYLGGAALHIDGDSGLVHARALAGKPSLVMYGPTDSRYYGYPQNINIQSPFCSPCLWLRNDWMKNCALGHPVPTCMDKITPEMVLEKIKEALL